MPWNGSGVASPPGADYPAVSLTVISSSVRNALDADIYTSLSNCITKDGQQTVTANIPMGGFKVTGLGLGTASTDAASVQNANALAMCEFRLTVVTGNPVGSAAAATTLFFSPYKGNRIALFDGTNWNMRSSAEMSIAVPNTTSQMYDVFCWDNAGVPTLELLAWTNDTTRATALTTQNGVLSKTGALTRRYVGSMRTTTVAGQTEDDVLARFVWNYYNRIERLMEVTPAASTWNYTTATIRQANADTLNQLNFIVGFDEQPVKAEWNIAVSNTNTGVVVASGVSLDLTNSFGGSFVGSATVTTAISNGLLMLNSRWIGLTGVGRHFLAALEYSTATGTTTWSSNLTAFRGILTGTVWG